MGSRRTGFPVKTLVAKGARKGLFDAARNGGLPISTMLQRRWGFPPDEDPLRGYPCLVCCLRF